MQCCSLSPIGEVFWGSENFHQMKELGGQIAFPGVGYIHAGHPKGIEVHVDEVRHKVVVENMIVLAAL